MKLQKNKEKVILEAANLFYYKGYHNTSVDKIIEKSKLSKGTFYHYFSSKQDLLYYVIDYHTQTMVSIFKKIVDNLDKEKLKEFFNFYYKQIKKNKYKGGSPLGNLVLELSDNEEEIRLALKKAQNTILNRIIIFITLNNKIEVEDAQILGNLIFNCFEGTISRIKLEKNLDSVVSFNYLIDRIIF